MARKGPLRKVIDTVAATTRSGFTRMFDVLECGHVNRVPTDIYGETNAYRRRCSKCRRELPPEDSKEVIGEWKKRFDKDGAQ